MLEIRGFSKTYKGGKRAVDSLNLTVEDGGLFGFIGHNGAGKTTTIRAIAGVLEFEEGDILVDGLSVRTDPVEAKRKMAYIPDNPDLYEYLTGIQYLNFIGDIFGLSAADREADIRAFSDRLELTPRLGDLISSYSHGMKQKLAVISALIHHPRLLILDEPFVGLDPVASHTLKEIMKELCAQGGAIFFSTHVLEVAEKLCTNVAVIKDGRLAACGTLEEVRGSRSLEDVFMGLIDHE